MSATSILYKLYKKKNKNIYIHVHAYWDFSLEHFCNLIAHCFLKNKGLNVSILEGNHHLVVETDRLPQIPGQAVGYLEFVDETVGLTL